MVPKSCPEKPMELVHYKVNKINIYVELYLMLDMCVSYKQYNCVENINL
jgi:hypothetical protein